MRIIVGCFVVLLFLLSGCRSNSVIIERSVRFTELSSSIKKSKILYVNTDVSAYYVRNAVNMDFFLEESLSKDIDNLIIRSAMKNAIQADIISGNAAYGNNISKIQQLKRGVNVANKLQDNLLDRRKKYGLDKLFVYSPRISPEYAELSKIFGTPFFGFCGVFSADVIPISQEARAFVRENRNVVSKGRYFYFYHIVVNVETGEIIYREIRKVPVKTTNSIIHTTVFDSFFMLKKYLKK